MKRISALALLLAFGVSTTQAAELSASVRFTNLAFSASDLTPGDGVAPFYELLPSEHWKSTTSVYRDQPAFFDNDNVVPFLGDASVATTFIDGATARAQVTSNSVESQAAGPANSTYLLQASGNLVGSFYAPLIRIAPGTRLTFSGNAELLASATCPNECYALALLEFDFGYYGEEGSYTKTLMTSLAAPSQSFTAPVSLSYANTSTEDQYLGLVVHADVELSNTAVPEPATWALVLGGGLVALGFGRHRRRKDWQNPALD